MTITSIPAGSLLLESLKDHISTTAQDHCKAIYLHVLTTNSTAIHFYENRDFKQHHYLPYYYSIRGVLKDGFTYVLYINGGHPPWTILYPLLLRGQEGLWLPSHQSGLQGQDPCTGWSHGRLQMMLMRPTSWEACTPSDSSAGRPGSHVSGLSGRTYWESGCTLSLGVPWTSAWMRGGC